MPAVAIILIWLCAFALIPQSVAYNIPGDILLRPSSSPDALRHRLRTELDSSFSWRDKAPRHSPAAFQRRSTNSPRHDSKYVFDERRFNTTTASTCLDALSGFKSAINPSGIAACYNVAFLNEETNVFGADVKLYAVSEANGEFKNTRWEDYDLKMDSRLIAFSGLKRIFLNSTSDSTANSPRLVMEWQYSGKVNELVQLKKLTADEHRYLLTPNMTLTTNSPSQPGNTIRAKITSDTLSYTAGYLASDGHAPYNVTTSNVKTQLKHIILASLEFELPGTRLGIFPMGLIVTGAWTGIFLIILGYGALERKRYRDFHQDRLKYAASIRGYGRQPIVP
ncbi:hypothetical protein FQN49_007621 [Arthroderma sp. PD_2]|nr:hypothetical protein FQN49_007621 [Arthroderma sp. PD_2]